MAVERSGASFLSRSGPALAVIGIHVLIVYGLVVSMGIVQMPKFAEPIEAVFIPEQTQQEPEPEMKIKPDIQNPVAVDEPVPEVQFDEPVTPPAETPIAGSATAITAAPANGAPAQDLRTSTRIEPTYPSASRRAGEEGSVRLKVLVDERGRPQQGQRLCTPGQCGDRGREEVALRRRDGRHEGGHGVDAGRGHVQADERERLTTA
jgi:periplasmic protein TonB